MIELRELYPAIIIQNNISLDPDNRLKDLISYLSIMKEDEYRLMLSALIDTLFDKSSVYYQQSLVDEMYIHADKLLKDYTEKIVYRTSRVVYFSELDINRFKAWSIVNFGIAPQIIEVNFLMVNDYRYLANTNRGIIQFNLLRNRLCYPEIIQNMMEYVLVILELGDGLETTVEMVSQIIDNTRYNMENGAWELLTMSAVLSENIKSTSLRGKSVQLALQTGRFRLGTQFTYVYCKPFTITLERDISKFLKKGDGIPCEVAEIGTEYELDRARYLDLLGEVIKYIAPFINYRMTNI